MCLILPGSDAGEGETGTYFAKDANEDK